MRDHLELETRRSRENSFDKKWRLMLPFIDLIASY
jgi:hypothetical protein